LHRRIAAEEEPAERALDDEYEQRHGRRRKGF
jgi:hypothetical protein